MSKRMELSNKNKTQAVAKGEKSLTHIHVKNIYSQKSPQKMHRTESFLKNFSQ